MDVEILSGIADYVNTNYKLKKRLAGVLYLHDITKAKMGGVGARNIRVLENFIGLGKFNNCTIVTTKWGCTTDPNGEQGRENTLRTDDRYFASMLQSETNQPDATLRRFDPKSKGIALDIIKLYLENSFVPHMAEQMVNPNGPKLALGETEAGKHLADNVERLRIIAETKQEREKLKKAQGILAKQYDESLFQEFKEKRRSYFAKSAYNERVAGLCARALWVEQLRPPCSH